MSPLIRPKALRLLLIYLINLVLVLLTLNNKVPFYILVLLFYS